MLKHKDLFSARQLVALTTFSQTVKEIQSIIEQDALNAGMADDKISLNKGGKGALAYSQAICVYLAFLVDQIANHSSTICSWNAPNTQLRNTFARQAIPMVWDFAEANIFSNSSGSFNNLHDRLCKAFVSLGNRPVGKVEQFDAQCDLDMKNMMVSTDPPYYDNIGYADLSDFFYVWMRKILKDIYPELFGTMLVPKKEELIATPFRFDGNSLAARHFFENGMYNAFKQVYKIASDDIPVTIYYAFKQTDSVGDEEANDSSEYSVSTGWETMLSAIIRAGFSITGTWPVRTEKPGRSVGIGTNALASSIVLVCRKRPDNAPQTTRRNLIAALRKELRYSLKKLQESNIAPVDLAQSAIGPGMGVFSKYQKVLDADGTEMSVRSALATINEELDFYFNEQVGNLDMQSRFCVELYTQCAYNEIKYGEAEILANAKGISIPILASHGLLYAKAGIVRLIERCNLPETFDVRDNIWLLAQQLTRAMSDGGIEACAKIVVDAPINCTENAKDLAYRLFSIAERKGWAEEAYAYNSLVVAWPDIQTRLAELKSIQPRQLELF